jgi:biopolymer transport protein ExbB/TolQ
VGLIIAMLATGFFNYFTKKTSDIVSKVEAAMREFLVILAAVRG